VNPAPAIGKSRRRLGRAMWLTTLLGTLAKAALPSSEPRDDFWVPDGPVFTVLEHRGVIYIGGLFDYVSPVAHTGKAFDAAGLALPEFPVFEGAIKAVLNDNAGGWFIGGYFTSVGGYPITNLVHIKAGMAVDTAWTPNPDNTVFALASDGTRLFAGGSFANIGGQTRSLLAALEPSTGGVLSWRADCRHSFGGGVVKALVASDGRLYIGGFISHVRDAQGEYERVFVASVDAATGTVNPWFPNGYVGASSGSRVDALAIAGTTLYAGGTFTTFGGYGNINGRPFGGIVALDVNRATHSYVTNWNPDADAPVTSIAVACDAVYVGGDFRRVGGETRARLAAIEPATGTNTGRAKTTWKASANNQVTSLMLAGNTLYVGGRFTAIGGQPRNFLAALEADTATVTHWAPRADFAVAGAALSGGVLVSGGALGPGGKVRKNVAALDARTGQALDWAPQIGGGTYNSGTTNPTVYALAAWGTNLYIGGAFTEIDAQPRPHLAAVDARTGALTPWNPGADDVVEALVASPRTIWLGGSFTNVAGFSRNHLAAVDAATGLPTAWNPNANDKVVALTRKGSTIYAGGRFTELSGQRRARLGAINARGAATSWDPGANNEVNSVSFSGARVVFGGDVSLEGTGFRAILGAARPLACWAPEPHFANGRFATVNAVLAFRNTVFAGGAFDTITDDTRRFLAAVSLSCPPQALPWNPDLDGPVNALTLARGSLYAAGTFRRVGGRYRPNLAVFPPEGAPSVTDQPVSQIVSAGESVVLEAVATGRQRISFQWRRNGVNVPGANEPTLTIPAAQVADSGDYVLVVTNRLGLVHSRAATLTVIEPLEVISQPQNQNVVPSATVTLSVAATGHPAPMFQWRLNGTDIPGAIESTFTITNAQPTNGGAYNVVVVNSAEAIESDFALVTVTAPALPLTDDFGPAAPLVPLGGAEGVGSGTNVGATRESGETNHVGKAGGTSVWLAWVAPARGIATFSTRGSSFDTLLAVYTGDAVTNLTAIAADEDDGGFLTSQLSFNATAGTTYRIAVDGFAGAVGHIVVSWNLDTTEAEFPRIINHPESVTVTNGATAVFRVDVDTNGLAAAQLKYQWFRDCEAIPGATDATLIIPQASVADVGSYRVFVENADRRVAESFTANLDLGLEPKVQSADKLEDISDTPTDFPAAKAAKQLGGTYLVRFGPIQNHLLNNSAATRSPGESNHCGVIGGRSKWFKFQPAADGVMEVDTIGSSIDTVLAVYLGRRATGLRYVTCDDNGAPDGIRSAVQFAVQQGTNYSVVVDGRRRARGAIQMNWRLLPPPMNGAALSIDVGQTSLSAGSGGILAARAQDQDPSSTRLAQNAFRITGVLRPGWVLEATTDFESWQPVWTNTSAETRPFQFAEPEMNTRTRRFYRIVPPR